MNERHTELFRNAPHGARAAQVIAAGAIAVGGVWLAWRAVGPVASAPAPASGPAPSENGFDLAAPGVVALPASLSTPVTVETAPAVAAAIVSRLRDGFVASTERRPPDEEGLLREAQSILSVYLAGSFEAYVEHLRTTGARTPLLTGENPDLAAQQETLWKHNAAVIAQHPVSVDGAMIRPRTINGRDLAPPDLGPTAWVTFTARYGLAEESWRDRQTIYEVLVPVLYEWENRRGPVWWGFWLARTPDGDRWVQVRSVIYDPAGIDAGIVPTF